MISKVYKILMNVSVVTVVAVAFAIACGDDDKEVSSDPVLDQLSSIQTDVGNINTDLEGIMTEDPTVVMTLETIQNRLSTIQTGLGNLQNNVGAVQLANLRMRQDDLTGVQTDLGTVAGAVMGEDATLVSSVVMALMGVDTALDQVDNQLVTRLGGPIQAEFGINPDLNVDRGSDDPARLTLGLRVASALDLSNAATLNALDIKVDHVLVSQSGNNPTGNVWLSRVDEMDNVLSVQLAVAATKTALESAVNAFFGSGNYDAVVPYINEANMFRVSDQYFRMTLPNTVDTVMVPMEFMYAYLTTLSSGYQIADTDQYFSSVPSLLSLELYDTYGGSSFSTLEDNFSNSRDPVPCTDLTGKQCFSIDVSSGSATSYIVLRDANDPDSLLDAFRFVFSQDSDTNAVAPNALGGRASACSADDDDDLCDDRDNNN